MSNTEIRNINFVVPKNATNVTIMFQLPDESSIQKVVVEKKVMSDTANLSKTQQVIAAVERYPSMRIESVAHMTGLSAIFAVLPIPMLLSFFYHLPLCHSFLSMLAAST